MKEEQTSFARERERLNQLLIEYGNKSTKRFLNLDEQVYCNGVLDRRTKEMMGLVASLVLRCNDCIKYHLIQCHEQAVTREELQELLSVALIVGGSITIPHIRKAVAFWDEL